MCVAAVSWPVVLRDVVMHAAALRNPSRKRPRPRLGHAPYGRWPSSVFVGGTPIMPPCRPQVCDCFSACRGSSTMQLCSSSVLCVCVCARVGFVLMFMGF